MPGLTTIMILTNVGLQIFNSWRNTNTNDEMRRKQQAFQEAAQERNHEKMMQLLREGQAIQEQTEEDMHNLRMQNIENDFDNLIKRIFQQQALHQWPLRVLPMVMKNQSLGSIKRSNENIALHVILTPSNSDNFNNVIFPKIELELENFLNQYWNTNSTHPIIFYSGAWKSNIAPTQNDIEQLHTDLSHLPVLVLTPKFQPNGENLVFTINMWGVETSNNNINKITIQPTEQELTYYKIYAPDTKYGDKLTEITIKEFVPYLQSMIGYLADVYFWSLHNRAPILPSLLSIGAIDITGLNYLVINNRKHYEELFLKCEKELQQNPYLYEHLMTLYEGIDNLWSIEDRGEVIERLVLDYVNSRMKTEHIKLEQIDEDACKFIDKSFIDKFISLSPNESTKSKLMRLKDIISHLPVELKIKHVSQLTLKELINNAYSHIPDSAEHWHLIVDQMNQKKMIVAFFTKGDEVVVDSQSNVLIYITLRLEQHQNVDVGNYTELTIEQLKEIKKMYNE